jgi:hypothetical protein
MSSLEHSAEVAKLAAARYLALSRDENLHNAESPWYIEWSHRLGNLVKTLHNAIVGPQVSLMIHLEGVHLGDNEGGSDDDSNASATTVSEEPDVWVIPDFMIYVFKGMKLQATARLDDGLHHKFLGHRIEGTRIAIVVECKRHPTRLQTIEAEAIFNKQRDGLLANARLQAQSQAAAVFEKEGTAATTVLALAAAGHYWRYAKLQRRNLNERDWQVISDGGPFIPPAEFIAPKWSAVFELGTPMSDEKMKEIHAFLEEVTKDFCG